MSQAERSSNVEPEVHKLRRGSLGVLAISFFVISAAAPLTAMAGGAPVAMLLGNGSGIPAAYVVVSVLLLVFSVGYTAMARHHTSTGAFYSYVTRGLGQPSTRRRRVDRAARLQHHADRPVRAVRLGRVRISRRPVRLGRALVASTATAGARSSPRWSAALPPPPWRSMPHPSSAC